MSFLNGAQVSREVDNMPRLCSYENIILLDPTLENVFPKIMIVEVTVAITSDPWI